MPNFVAIEICDRCLLVACAKTNGRRYQINHLFEIDSSEGQTNASLGESLKAELQNRGVTRAELIGVVNRRDSELREVSVPPAPANELPDLVRFQARNVFASLNDNWLFDFVPFDEVDGEKQKVLAMAIAPEINSQFSKIAASAGLTLKRILYRPYSIVGLFNTQLDDTSNKIIVMPVDHRLDFIVVAGKKVVAARSFQSCTDEDADPEIVVNQVVGELKRTMASTRALLNGQKIDEVIVAGEQQQAVADFKSVLTKSLDIAVSTTNPLGILNGSNFTADPIPESTERFAALIGSLASESTNKKPAVDFLNPRRPVVKKTDFRKFAIAAVMIGLLLTTGFALRWIVLSQQSEAVAKKREELDKVRLMNKGDSQGDNPRPGVDQIIGEVTALDNWYSQKVNWLDELVWVSDKMPSADDIRVSRFQGTTTRDGFIMNLETKMTEQVSSKTEWKTLFADRYLPDFGGVEEAASDTSGFDVKRKFKLERLSDVNDTIDKVSDIIDDELDALAAADASPSETADDDAEMSEAKVSE